MGTNCELPSSDSVQSPEALARLKIEKGVLSRQIGEAKANGEPTAELIHRMRLVSERLKSVQKGLKAEVVTEDKSGKEDAACNAPIAPQRAILDLPEPEAITIVENVQDSAECRQWDMYVANHPAGSFAHTMAFRNAQDHVYGHNRNYIAAFDERRQITGVLPLIQLNSRLFGNFIVSVPYLNYGGLLANDRVTARQLLDCAEKWRSQVGAKHVELRHASDIEMGLPQRKDKVTFWLPLPDSEQQLWKQFSSKLRAQIRRAEREGPRIEFGGLHLLDEFYQVFARNMRDLGTPVYGKSFFKSLLEAYPEKAHLVIARIDGRAVGAAFLLGFKDRMEIPWASTLKKYNSTGVNMLMYWAILKHAIALQYQVFDFGRCTEDSGTYRFKKQWGATPVPLYWDYCLGSESSLPGLNPDNPKFRLLISIWKKMPVLLTKLIGPMVVRSLP